MQQSKYQIEQITNTNVIKIGIGKSHKMFNWFVFCSLCCNVVRFSMTLKQAIW
jgi:hypothetical protein